MTRTMPTPKQMIPRMASNPVGNAVLGTIPAMSNNMSAADRQMIVARLMGFVDKAKFLHESNYVIDEIDDSSQKIIIYASQNH